MAKGSLFWFDSVQHVCMYIYIVHTIYIYIYVCFSGTLPSWGGVTTAEISLRLAFQLESLCLVHKFAQSS